MVTDYNVIRESISAAVQTFAPDMNVYHYVPRSLVPPAAIVRPRPNRTIDYMQAQSSGLAKWNFIVLLVIGLVDEEAAQTLAGKMISPGSDLIVALQNAELPNGFTQVVQGSVNEMMFDQALYTYAELDVVVTS